MDFTCLTREQIKDLFSVNEQAYNPSRVKANPTAYITDFAILLGGSAIVRQKQRIGSWISQILPEKLVTVVSTSSVAAERDTKRINGTAIRVAIDTSNIGTKAFNGQFKKISKDDESFIARYGEMPQDKVWCGSELEQELLKIYFSDIISYTEKIHKFYYQNELLNFKEFLHQGKKYIVVDTDFRKNIKHPYNDSCFSDGSHAEKVNFPIFFEVKPIEWIVNFEKEVAYTDKLLFPIFPIKYQNNDFFESTNIYKFLNEEFKKNISIQKTESKKIDTFDLELISDLDEISRIKNFVECDIPVFLHGKSGDGKSARVKQIDPNSVVIYMRNATPEALVGKSIVSSEKEKLIDIPPTWYLKLCEKCQKEPDKLHILFFDELTNALPSIQSMAFNIILKKEVNGIWKLPENARIIAAGNEIGDSLAAYELAEPLHGRFAHIFIDTDVDNWCIWAMKNNIHPLIVSFIKLHGVNVLRSKYTGESPNADPRKWEMASRMLYKTNNPYMLKSLVGTRITKKFIEFLSLKTYQLKDVIDNKFTGNTQMSKQEKYLTAYTLSFALENDLDKVYKFMQTLGEGADELFKLLWKYNHKQYNEPLDEISEKSKTLTK